MLKWCSVPSEGRFEAWTWKHWYSGGMLSEFPHTQSLGWSASSDPFLPFEVKLEGGLKP